MCVCWSTVCVVSWELGYGRMLVDGAGGASGSDMSGDVGDSGDKSSGADPSPDLDDDIPF